MYFQPEEVCLGRIVRLTRVFIVDMYHAQADHIKVKENKGSNNSLK